jgi:hypothetical protein
MNRIYKALRPYFIGLHFSGRKPGQEGDPDSFETWKAQSEDQISQWLEELREFSEVPHSLRRYSEIKGMDTRITRTLEKRGYEMSSSTPIKREQPSDEYEEMKGLDREDSISTQPKHHFPRNAPMCLSTVETRGWIIMTANPDFQKLQAGYVERGMEMKTMGSNGLEMQITLAEDRSGWAADSNGMRFNEAHEVDVKEEVERKDSVVQTMPREKVNTGEVDENGFWNL